LNVITHWAIVAAVSKTEAAKITMSLRRMPGQEVSIRSILIGRAMSNMSESMPVVIWNMGQYLGMIQIGKKVYFHWGKRSQWPMNMKRLARAQAQKIGTIQWSTFRALGLGMKRMME
jgi:hypothetical protein